MAPQCRYSMLQPANYQIMDCALDIITTQVNFVLLRREECPYCLVDNTDPSIIIQMDNGHVLNGREY